MGNRISISFKNRVEESPVLFSHSDGMALVEEAKEYVEKIGANKERVDPLGRLDPRTVMVDFISRVVGKGKEVRCNYYLCSKEKEGDNSDNGHHVIELGNQEKEKSGRDIAPFLDWLRLSPFGEKEKEEMRRVFFTFLEIKHNISEGVALYYLERNKKISDIKKAFLKAFNKDFDF